MVPPAVDEVLPAEPAEEFVSVGWRDDVMTIGLNRPKKLNALSTDREKELLGALCAPAVAGARAVVLYGLGRAFCAGADTSQLVRSPAEVAT